MRYSLRNPHAYADSNLLVFVNILECCRHNAVKHLVYASTSSVYGGNTKLLFSEHGNVDHPVSLYAATKKANEVMATPTAISTVRRPPACASSPSVGRAGASIWRYSCSRERY